MRLLRSGTCHRSQVPPRLRRQRRQWGSLCVCVCAWGGETSRWETWLPFPAHCASAEAERSCCRPPLRWTSSAERRPFRAAGLAPCVGTRQWRPHQGAAAGPVLNRASSLVDRLLPPRPGPSALLLLGFIQQQLSCVAHRGSFYFALPSGRLAFWARH